MWGRLAIAVALFGTGCWVTPSEISQQLGESGLDTDTGPVAETLEIVSISPTMASNGGGAEIEIVVTALGPDLEVLFGDRVAQVVGQAGSLLTVTMPRSSMEGAVDVTVRSGGQQAVAVEGIYLWPDGTDLMGAIGRFEYAHFHDRLGLNPEYTVSAQMGFVSPIDFEGFELWAPRLDQCSRNYSVDQSDWVMLDTGAGHLELESGSTAVAISGTADPSWFQTDLSEADYLSNARYDLRPFSGGEHWPAVEISGFLQTPPGEMRVTSPNLDSVTAGITRTVALKWQDAGTGDFIVVYIGRYEADVLKETVTCALRDDGEYLISGSFFSDWSLLGQAYFAMGRVKRSTAILPHNNSRSEVMGIRWSTGWVWQN
jgi:hypothetical protein